MRDGQAHSTADVTQPSPRLTIALTVGAASSPDGLKERACLMCAWRSADRYQRAELFQADPPAVANDDGIDKLDAEELAGLEEALRDAADLVHTHRRVI